MADAQDRGWGPGWPNCQTDKFVKVRLSNGVAVVARREIAELVKLIYEEGIRRGYAPRDGQTWGASCRAIKGTSTPSNHSWALAFDTNSLANPQRRPLTTDMPKWWVDLWKRYGFRWGGDYVRATPDSMHTEFMGTPADAARFTEQARRELAGADHHPVPVPPPQEDDDMLAFTQEIPPDGKTHTVPVPPPGPGGLGNLRVWASLATDHGGSTVRLARGAPGAWRIEDKLAVTAGRPWVEELVTGDQIVSVKNNGPEHVTVLVEAGRR